MQRRKDNAGRVLKDGESQRKDGMYMYRWTTRDGKRQYLYSSTLLGLREKEYVGWDKGRGKECICK